MFTLSQRLWISFATILAIAITLATVIVINGNNVSTTAQRLIEQQLPRLALIKQLRAAISEHERLLYEYYATVDRELLWPEIIEKDETLQDLMVTAHQAFSRQILTLPNIYADIKFYRQSLEENLSSNNINWDRARSDLAKLTDAGEQAEATLSTLTQEVQNNAWNGAESTKEQINHILIFVLVFTLITLIAGIYVAYISQMNIKRSAKRRALAMFPERNPSPVMNLNWQGHILFANPACAELLKRLNMDEDRAEELLPANFYRNLKRWQNDRKTLERFETEIKGRQLAYNLSLLPDLGSCHLYIEDITERKQAEDQLQYQAYHDIHTGLANRRQFELDLGRIIEQKLPISVMFVAIDRFKLITASQGYFIGDQIIKEFGSRLVHVCEALDFSAMGYRLDGYTFCVLINSPKSQHAWDTAYAIQSSMDESLQVNDHRYYLTLSMGFCHFPEHGRDAKALITNGNAALNSAKLKGDNISQYSEQHHGQEQSWLPIEAKIRKALEWNEFELHYQAKVDGQDHSIKGAEALIRLKDDNGNNISPGRFIPVAEQTGLIVKIGQWVIEKGFRQAKAWYDQGIKIKLAINISARQFQDRYFLTHLHNQLSETQVNPASIELEITESLLMENAEQSIDIMKQLKAMGFALAIDDFGTGYSSLAYLKRFPIDTLKVDQTFVRNLETDRDDQNIVRAIVALGQHLNLDIVAEGVETNGQLSFLKTLNVNYIQGFLFSKPNVAEKLFED